jgi:hypothetical protein
MFRALRLLVVPAALIALALLAFAPTLKADVTGEEVERAIKNGVHYLIKQQRADGSWAEIDDDARTGPTSLVTLALLTAGEAPDSPPIAKALEFLRKFDPGQLDSVYSVSLQTMVFAAATPKDDIVRIQANVDWLQEAQLKPGDHALWPGSWSYKLSKTRHGDNSNTQYALLGLYAATEAGIKVREDVWKLSREYWERYQQRDGSWAYTPDATNGMTASMTCAGISSLIISGLKRFQGAEKLVGEHQVENCGKGTTDEHLERGINWMATHFRVGENYGASHQWKYYFLYGLERTGRLSGVRFFGNHDWYREGAEHLVHEQDKLDGFWRGQQYERFPMISTSFALLFLAKGRSPVVINKLRHGEGTDWNNDVDDVRNLVGAVSRDWNHLMTWQVVNPNVARVEDMLQAPIAFFNGHEAPVFTDRGIRILRDFVDQGGFIFAEACCGSKEFDKGFRDLMKRVFSDEDPDKKDPANPRAVNSDYELRPLLADHPVWRSKWRLDPNEHPLWGIEHGCRTVVIYSPEDLSCDWNQLETQAELPRVTKSTRIGQNVVDYATGRELPADKLAVPDVKDFKSEPGRRGALRIAKLRHAGDWNVAPLAIPNLTTTLRDKLKFDVVINHKEMFPTDPNLVHYPLIYIHGRAALSFDAPEKAALRKHLDPGGGTFFADAACGSVAFDTAFRKFVAELLPNNPMVAIPRDDELYTTNTRFDLKDVQYTKAAGGGKDFPQLEGVKINGRWAVIYSKYDLGCALERHQGLDCKGYTYESAMRIASNIVIYATLP